MPITWKRSWLASLPWPNLSRPKMRLPYRFWGQVLHDDHPFGIIQICRVNLSWFGHQASLPDRFVFVEFSDAF